MNVKNDFPLLEKEIVYLDSAATTQKPKQVIDALENYYKTSNANPHRGAYDLSQDATNIYENTRKKVKDFINAKDSSQIIFTKNATEGLNLVAYSYGLNNVDKGEKIVLSIMEHHSNLVPWQMVSNAKGASLEYIYLDGYDLDYNMLDKIDEKTKIVAITYISNVLGAVNDIEKIIAKAHSVGAKVVLDATQAIAHKKIDVQKLDVDFMIFSGHKMLGPMGVGVLYAKKDLLDNMTPFLFGGDMIEYVYEDKTEFASIPNKFEAGTQNVEAVYGLGVAIDYIDSIGMEKIESYEKELADYTKKKLEELDFLDVYIPKNYSNVFSFNFKKIHPHDISTLLNEDNICVRTGNHCAQPLLRHMGVDSTIRVSTYIYNTKEDIDKLIFSLKRAYKFFEKYIKE